MPESKDLLVLGFPEYTGQADRIAGPLDSAGTVVDVHRFEEVLSGADALAPSPAPRGCRFVRHQAHATGS